jgi:hypothetical protein
MHLGLDSSATAPGWTRLWALKRCKLHASLAPPDPADKLQPVPVIDKNLTALVNVVLNSEWFIKEEGRCGDVRGQRGMLSPALGGQV